jgi:hypothetical protein
MSLTERVSDLTRRVGALENAELEESDSIPLISKIFKTVNCTPIYCDTTLACNTTLACDDDAAGIVSTLAEQLTHIGIGTGAAPGVGDTLLADEAYRKIIVDPVIVDNTYVASVFWDESEANGATYTNAGIFLYGTDTVDTGTLFFGDAINQEKDSTKNLTIGVEITAVEV